MTIHKAKGLEFDTVIVPGLGASTARDERKLLLWVERAADLLLAPINPTGSDKDPIYEYIRLLEAEKADHEAGRLLYVAATRAKKVLHWLGDTRLDRSGAPLPPPRGALLAKLWPAVRHRFVPEAAAEAAPGSSPAPAPPAGSGLEQTLRRLPRDWSPPPAPASVNWRGPVAIVRRDDVIEFSWAGETARHVGTVVHRWLQRFAEDGLALWSAARVDALHARFMEQLRARGVTGAGLEDAARRVGAALLATLNDPRGQWLLAAHAASRNEWRLARMMRGEARTLIIDRTFVDEGMRWIVDYKTSVHEGADIESFLDAERERYRAQLENYASVLALDETRPISIGLYFPLLGGWREWRYK